MIAKKDSDRAPIEPERLFGFTHWRDTVPRLANPPETATRSRQAVSRNEPVAIHPECTPGVLQIVLAG